jgi:predicted short-subunit dehydrogenase-like oxidoreductase (DUF2520 family)
VTQRPKHRRQPKAARWEKRHDDGARPPVVIIGFGRLGGALALGLKRGGWPVTVFPRSAESVRRAAGLGLTLAEHEALRQAKICILAVPDGVVGALTLSLLPDLGTHVALVHCAGALSLAAFGDLPKVLKHARGSFHPLCAVSSPEDDLSGHTVALSATTPGLNRLLSRMAEDLELTPIQVPESERPAYHAGAVLSAGGLVALASAAVEALGVAGIPEDEALSALLPLMKSAIRGLEKRGLSGGLTGPVARGDAGVVRAHLAALPPHLAGLYRDLSRRALARVGAQLPPEARAELEGLLGR